MKRTLIECGAVLTGGLRPKWIPRGALLIERDRIAGVLTREQARRIAKAESGLRVRDMTEKTALPGFVQSHVHLCQTSARGIADDLHLMDWLKKRIFPYEAALTEKTLRASVRKGLAELLFSGTTCVMDMGTLRHTDVIGEELLKSGIRACFGKCLIDRNDILPRFKESSATALKETVALARRWHNRSPRLKYAFTPRFILSCSDGLMREAFSASEDFPGSRFHTHASENPVEMKAVRARCGMGNVKYLDRLGVVDGRTGLAHCVQLEAGEYGILRRTGAHVLHCPSSNLKLASGVADVVKMAEMGISVSIGTDGAACNNRLDIFSEMRLASLLQKPRHGPRALPARQAFFMATYGGARALGWEDETGSLETGKAADIVWVDLHRGWMPDTIDDGDSCYSALVYAGRPENVTDVLIAGEWIVQNARLRYTSAP